MGLGWSEVQILSPRPILQLHRAGPPTGSGLDVDLGCCGAWPEGKPRESRACPPWPVTARRAPRCVNPPTVRPRGLQPTGRPADNLFKRKPPPPCPFALAGASAPAFFLAVQRRGGAHRHPRGTEGASALLTGRSTPWRARSAHERVEPVPCAPCPVPRALRLQAMVSHRRHWRPQSGSCRDPGCTQRGSGPRRRCVGPAL